MPMGSAVSDDEDVTDLDAFRVQPLLGTTVDLRASSPVSAVTNSPVSTIELKHVVSSEAASVPPDAASLAYNTSSQVV